MHSQNQSLDPYYISTHNLISYLPPSANCQHRRDVFIIQSSQLVPPWMGLTYTLGCFEWFTTFKINENLPRRQWLRRYFQTSFSSMWRIISCTDNSPAFITPAMLTCYLYLHRQRLTWQLLRALTLYSL